MYGVGLALALAGRVAAQTLTVIPPEGGATPERLEVEALGPQSRVLSLATLPVAQRVITLPASFAGAEAVRVVGPNVISEPVAIGSGARSIRLAPAGRLQVGRIPQGVRRLRLLMRLEGSMHEFQRDIEVSEPRELELAAPLGTFAAVLDLGPESPPLLFPEIAIPASSSVARIEIKESKGKPLSLHVVSKEDGKPIAGGSIMGRPTAELPPVMWRALARRCGVSDTSGSLSCGAVPLALQAVEVVAPQRRRAHAVVPKVPEGPLRAVLAPYQNLRVAPALDRGIPPKLLDGLMAVVARCERPPCDEMKALRKPLPAKSRSAIFPRLEPGRYQVWLETPAVRSSGLSFDIAADSDAIDTAEAAPHLQLWPIAVFTHLKSGEAIPAHIWLGMYWENESEQQFAGDAWTDKEGRYERYLLAEAGRFMTVHAYSDTPSAAGMTTPPGVRLPYGGDRVFLDLELLTSGGKVKLIDKETKQPIVDCSVDLAYWGPSSGGAGRKKSDAEGIVSWLGVSKGSFRADAACDGYRTASTGKVEISDKSDPTILELEPAAALRLRVRDGEGNLLPGAAVYVEQSDFDVNFPFQMPAELLGTTDFNGEIAVPIVPKPGMYVVAPHHALHVGRLPLCPGRGECISEIRLSRPAPFPGIRLRNAEGESEPPIWLVFLKDGVPIPVSIQSEVLRLNGGSPSLYMVHEGADIIHMLPGLFGPGVYDVGYARSRAGTSPQVIPLAQLVLPATQRVELTVPATK